ncbi:hypothetical protein DH2020_017127 [Rehmannia glutinosa]|uniref:X8 domain-containing protein n=1 Tax=Rehmannia glutinosa TaxID=99300 RepID=A0ABR0WQ71_REHGL
MARSAQSRLLDLMARSAQGRLLDLTQAENIDLDRWTNARTPRIGVNWGTVSNHRLSPDTVVDLLKDNKIEKVKLFDADPTVLKALMGSGIEVMCDCRYVAVGNEPFLTSYSGQFQSYIMPAMTNLQQSLAKVNLAGMVKLVVPCNADAYESSLPSQGTFRPELTQIITQLVSFLSSNGSPFVVNIYPFLSLYGNSDFPQDYAFFGGTTHPVTDGPNVYDNAFDGNFDTLVSALAKLGYAQMPIVIGEIGWPTDGALSANLSAARAFNQGFIKRVLSNQGTPLRPGVPPMDVYLFSLFDEGAKSVLPGTFERHWGIFSFDGQAKYQLNLGNGLLKNAKQVEYLPSRWCVANPTRDLSAVANHFKLACSYADCTTLNYGGSCNNIGEKGNISYAFNSYYQLQKQNPKSCEFDGLGMVTFLDPSVGDCRFLVGVTYGNSLGLSLNGRRIMFSLIIFWGFGMFLV